MSAWRGATAGRLDHDPGYSSLGYIDEYEIDAIKIDSSFALRMLTARRTLAIVKSILGLGRTLDLKIVAVGVETEAQLDLLSELRCPLIQGYLLARPLTADDMAALPARR